MRRRGPLFAGIAVGIVALLVLFALVLPKKAQVSKARKDLTQAQQQQQTLEAQLRSLQEAQKEAPKIKAELAKLATLIPPTADLPGMIRLLAAAADRSAVDFFSISPGIPTADPSGSFSIVPTAIMVNGGFFALDEFLFRLETLPRAVKITRFSVSQGPGFGQTGGANLPLELGVQITAEFYTTDNSAGPGSFPGPAQGAQTTTTGAPAAAPPSPGA